MLSDLINLNFGRISGGKHLHICVIGLIMQGPKKSFKRPKNHIFDHLEQMIYYTRPPWRRRLTIDPHQSSKENTHMQCSCGHFPSLKCSILTTIGPRTTRMMVYVCLLWQRLRHWFLPIATSNHLLSASSAQKFWVKSKYKLLHSMNVCVSCLTSVAWLTTQIFSFQPETLGKHWPKRNNLRVKAQSFKKRRQQGGIS